MIKNNIKNVLKQKNVSIKRLGEGINMHYPTAYELVNRKDLRNTHFGTLVDISVFLEVEITELFKKERKDFNGQK